MDKKNVPFEEPPRKRALKKRGRGIFPCFEEFKESSGRDCR